MTTIVVRRGLDGKDYPAAALSRTDRNRARWAAHNLIDRDGLSIRAAQQVMAEAGMRRSLGSIMRDLTLWECPACPHLNT